MANKRITFDLDEKIVYKMKKRVLEEGITQRQFITDLIKKELENDVE